MKEKIRALTSFSSVLSGLCALFPFLTGALILPLPPTPAEFAGYLDRYFSFLLLFGSWGVVRALSVIMVHTSSTDRRMQTRRRVLVAAIALAAIVFMFALHYFRTRFTPEHFSAVLFLLGTGALAHVFSVQNRLQLSYTARFIYCSGVAAFTLLLQAPEWPWQVLLIGLGIGALCVSIDLARAIATENRPSPAELNGAPQHHALQGLERSYAFLILCAPQFFLILIYFGQLAHRYLFIALEIPAAIWLLQPLVGRRARSPHFFTLARLLVLAFMALLLALRLL